jgi:hypothetical protein
MEAIEESSKRSDSGFLKQVFRFDDESKADMFNILQYSLLALVPIVILNKLSQRYIPEANEEKGSVEILAEIILQIFIIFIVLLFIDRIIRTVPTYSGTPYPSYNIVFVILPTLMIILSLQTKLGEKVSILVDRVADLWSGTDSTANKKKKKMKSSQPIAGNNMILSSAPSAPMVVSGAGGTTDINSLPPSSGYGTGVSQNVNYNDFFRKESTPLVNAATPGMESFVPMAANEGVGGAFGSAFGGGF